MYCDTIALKNCSMTVYIPDLVADPAVRRPTIVIAPGGGYTHLSTRESEPIALTFAAMGMNAVIVRYRVAPAVFPAPMQDIASAVAAIRQTPITGTQTRIKSPSVVFRRALMLSGCSVCIGRKRIGGRNCTSHPPTFARTP
ncbi:MAG: alpha/beta hydrolase fold domain-containing protein [Faecalibacterium sp.]|nr:alpha/beta hydrolase fold domain-containing protein [Faecalibacterium sp.]